MANFSLKKSSVGQWFCRLSYKYNNRNFKLKRAMRVFSGIQPTNQLHIGNYLGAIKQWLETQKTHQCLFCIVDLHALTAPYNPALLQSRVLEVAAAYLTAGLDPEKSIIFRQSDIKEHTELSWLLNTITSVGDLKRMTQFKEKSLKYNQNVNAGLLNYPVLMAADILLYQTDLVPVGWDQKQHIELTRSIAKKFNLKFGLTFKLPQALIPQMGAKIMSLTNPLKKMSKSDPSASFISLFDSPESIKRKIGSATTDSEKTIRYFAKGKPGISNLLTIYSLFSKKSIIALEKQFKGKGYQEFKKELAELLIEKLTPFREKRNMFKKSPKMLEKTLEQGAEKARVIAQETIAQVKKAMGLKLNI